MQTINLVFRMSKKSKNVLQDVKLCVCVQPEEDFNDDLMFPMPNRLSMAGAPESELDLTRPSDDLDTSPMQKKRLVRSSSDPSINTGDRVPGIPPYPAPPGYQRDSKVRVIQR